MEDEEIGLDFDIGSSTERPKQDVWESSSDSPSIQQDPESNDGQTSDKNAEDDEAVTTIARKLAKTLNTGSTESSEDSPIWPSRRKRRRLSISRSKAAAQEPHKEPETGQQRYMSPTKIAKIFKGKISPAKLCQLSELKRGSPTAVHKIMPGASVDQICRVVEL